MSGIFDNRILRAISLKLPIRIRKEAYLAEARWIVPSMLKQQGFSDQFDEIFPGFKFKEYVLAEIELSSSPLWEVVTKQSQLKSMRLIVFNYLIDMEELKVKAKSGDADANPFHTIFVIGKDSEKFGAYADEESLDKAIKRESANARLELQLKIVGLAFNCYLISFIDNENEDNFKVMYDALKAATEMVSTGFVCLVGAKWFDALKARVRDQDSYEIDIDLSDAAKAFLHSYEGMISSYLDFDVYGFKKFSAEFITAKEIFGHEVIESLDKQQISLN